MSMTKTQRFGLVVRKARLKKGWTQEKLMREINKLLDENHISRQWVANLESKLLKRNMAIEKVQAICKILDINENEIPTEDDNLPGVIHNNEIRSHDCLPLLRRVVSTDLNTLTFEQLVNLCEADHKLQKVGIKMSFLVEPTHPTHQQ